jgi:hypothetical protein
MISVRLCLLSVCICSTLNNGVLAQLPGVQTIAFAQASGTASHLQVVPFQETFNAAPDSIFGGLDKPTAVELTAEDTAKRLDTTAQLSAYASADVGILGVRLLGGVASDENGNAHISGRAKATWTDRAFLAAPIPAPAVIAKFKVFLDGSLDGVRTGTGGFVLTFDIEDENAIPSLPADPYGNFWGRHIETPTVSINDEIPGGFIFTRTVANSAEFTLGLTLVLDGSASTCGSGCFGNGAAILSADVSRTLRWGGIESVTDLSGNPIVGWTITSDSGFDYSRPFGVPEPAGIVLLVTALCSWWGSSRRPRH